MSWTELVIWVSSVSWGDLVGVSWNELGALSELGELGDMGELGELGELSELGELFDLE